LKTKNDQIGCLTATPTTFFSRDFCSRKPVGVEVFWPKTRFPNHNTVWKLSESLGGGWSWDRFPPVVNAPSTFDELAMLHVWHFLLWGVLNMILKRIFFEIFISTY
jgi:hypothetical protein